MKYYKEMISEFSVSANPSNQMDNYDIVSIVLYRIAARTVYARMMVNKKKVKSASGL